MGGIDSVEEFESSDEDEGRISNKTDTPELKALDQQEQDVRELTKELQSLQVTVCGNKEEEEVIPPDSLQKVAKWIGEGHCKRILVLSGAGVSCSAGIPDFRTPGTGLYDNLQKYNLPFPEAVFDLGFYRRNPKPFLSLAKQIWPGTRHSPTLTHSFIALLSRKGLLLRNYSQNIDGLEFLANVAEEEVVTCHGNFQTASCIKCQSPSFDCKMIILETDDVPLCHVCGGYVKPDIVFFGEGLPDRYMKLLPRDLPKADLLLIMGTSLLVAPVSMIPDMVGTKCKRVLLNRERVGHLHDKKRDVVHEGDCDESVRMLARLLDWEEELLELHQATQLSKSTGKAE